MGYLNRGVGPDRPKSKIFEEVGVSGPTFYRAIRPATAREMHLDVILQVLDHPACQLTEDERAEVTLAWLYTKAEVEGASSVMWRILHEVGEEMRQPQRGPVSRAVLRWLSAPPPRIRRSRGRPKPRKTRDPPDADSE